MIFIVVISYEPFLKISHSSTSRKEGSGSQLSLKQAMALAYSKLHSLIVLDIILS